MWYIISKQNSPKIVRKYRATRNFLQIYFLTLLKLISITAFNTSWFAVYIKKTLYFLVFHRNMGLKTSKHEFTDKRHQNKQGFEGKKLSGKEFLAFEEYQRVMCDLHGLLGELHAKILFTVFLPRFLLLILQNPSKWYASLVFGQNSSIQAFFAKPATKSLPHFSVFKKSWREADNLPGAGTSQIYLCAKFGGYRK